MWVCNKNVLLIIALIISFVQAFQPPQALRRLFRKFGSVDEVLPEQILVDVIEPKESETIFNEAQDFGSILASHKKCVLFAVPGAFTPTCSLKHLPGFIKHAEEIRSKGVDAIYCMSVNDRFVLKAWAEQIPDSKTSGIKFIADGNGAYASALGMVKDATGGRMGLRCKRFAAIINDGKITDMFVDEKGLDLSSAEHILTIL